MRVNKDKLIQSINQKWKTKNCPMCGHNNWNISDKMMTMLEIGENKDIVFGGNLTILPLVPITCSECGNTILVNPLVIECTED